jgi:hypothetical protein
MGEGGEGIDTTNRRHEVAAHGRRRHKLQHEHQTADWRPMGGKNSGTAATRKDGRLRAKAPMKAAGRGAAALGRCPELSVPSEHVELFRTYDRSCSAFHMQSLNRPKSLKGCLRVDELYGLSQSVSRRSEAIHTKTLHGAQLFCELIAPLQTFARSSAYFKP